MTPRPFELSNRYLHAYAVIGALDAVTGRRSCKAARETALEYTGSSDIGHGGPSKACNMLVQMSNRSTRMTQAQKSLALDAS